MVQLTMPMKWAWFHSFWNVTSPSRFLRISHDTSWTEPCWPKVSLPSENSKA